MTTDTIPITDLRRGDVFSLPGEEEQYGGLEFLQQFPSSTGLPGFVTTMHGWAR